MAQEPRILNSDAAALLAAAHSRAVDHDRQAAKIFNVIANTEDAFIEVLAGIHR